MLFILSPYRLSELIHSVSSDQQTNNYELTCHPLKLSCYSSSWCLGYSIVVLNNFQSTRRMKSDQHACVHFICVNAVMITRLFEIRLHFYVIDLPYQETNHASGIPLQPFINE